MNDLADLNSLSTDHLLNYLDRLKSQAESLLKDVRGVYIKTNPTSLYLKMKYEEQIPLQTEDFVLDMKFLDEKTIFILYTDLSYTLYDIVNKQTKQKNKLTCQNYSNLVAYNSNSIIFFDMTYKSIIIYDLLNCKEISSMNLTEKLIEQSLTLRVLNNEIVITYKKGDLNDEEEGTALVMHSYLVYELNEDIPMQNIKWTQKTSQTFSLGGLYCDKVHILKNKSLVLYNSFTRTNDHFIYQEYRDEKIRIRQRQSALQGQIVDFIEFSNSNKIGFFVNLHSDSQFKFIVTDLDQMTDITEQNISLISISKQVLVHRVFCFQGDRYLGLQIQNLSFGTRNIIYDIENQSIIAILQGLNVQDSYNKKNKLRLLLHNDDDSIENHSLKVAVFTKPSLPLMNFLSQKGILKTYGEQACKEIIDMLY